MILVYSYKIIHRLTYPFRQIFIRILELTVAFNPTLEKFLPILDQNYLHYDASTKISGRSGSLHLRQIQ